MAIHLTLLSRNGSGMNFADLYMKSDFSCFGNEPSIFFYSFHKRTDILFRADSIVIAL